MPDPIQCLVIEDDPVHGFVLKEQLELMGYVPCVVASAIQGLDMLGRESFRFALLDIRMPFMDGWQAVRTIRASPGPWRGMPIIVVTALAYQADIRRSFDAGVNGYIAKPHEFETLGLLIREVLREYPDGQLPVWDDNAELVHLAPLCCYLRGSISLCG